MVFIDLEPVSSSNLASVGYDDQLQILRVAFKNGTVYDYFNVSQDVYQNLMSAPSLGHFHYFNIRMSYAYQQV